MNAAHRRAFSALFASLVLYGPLFLTPAMAQGAGDTSATPTGLDLRGSSYLPLGHWAYDYIDVLLERGRLPDLQPLVQPYRRLDIARSIRKAEAERRFNVVEEGWVESIKRELKQEMDYLAGVDMEGVKANFEFSAGLKTLSQLHRDPLRPEGPSKTFVTFQINFYGNAPALAGALRARWDEHLVNDPQFPNGDAIEFRACDPAIDQCAYRVEDAYVEVQIPYVRIGFGRRYRNWGLPRTRGLQLSPYAYSYDVLNYRFGSDKISLTGFFTPLNDFKADTAHYVSAHRLDWRIRDNLSIGLGESVIYGGASRNVEFNLINPIGIWEISGALSGKSERNNLGFAEAWWRPYAGLLTYGSFVVDNTSVGDQGQGSGFTQYAGALGLHFPFITQSLSARLDFSVVSALAYRSRVAFFEYYSFDGLGLARDKTDVILLDAKAQWFALKGLFLEPGIEFQWKGEDNITDPFPDGAFTGRDKLLVGTVETTVRPVLDGRWHFPRTSSPWRGLSLELAFDAGLNVVKNKDHSNADWKADFVGSVWFRVVQAF